MGFTRTARRRVYYLVLEVRPRDVCTGRPVLHECAGAYVNAWVKAPSTLRAKKIVRSALHKEWVVISIQECWEVSLGEVPDAQREYVDAAIESGAFFLIHMYEKDDEEVIH